MLLEDIDDLRSKLKGHIFEMATSDMEDNAIRRMLLSLNTLYSTGFRHYYSDFLPIIHSISQEDNAYSLEWLASNLVKARIIVEKDMVEGRNEFQTLHQPLLKLSDHINLEIARYQYYSSNDQKLKDMEVRSKDLQNQLKELTEKINVESQNASAMQTQYMTILGIFAAIILAFVGNFSFSTSALQNIHQANIPRLVLVTLIVGFIFYNMICVLLGFLKEINHVYMPWLTKSNWCFNIILIIGIIVTIIVVC